MNEFQPVINGILSLIEEWEPKLQSLSEEVITLRKNRQNRSIKQILGHMVDSASNNIHRTIHMQYGANPLQFPNYATNGNNDRWIAIQNYQDEDWNVLINLWKYSNLHIVHVFQNVNPEKLQNLWQCSETETASLQDCIVDYLRHFILHLNEIDELIKDDAGC
jgi:hypothetical protein